MSGINPVPYSISVFVISGVLCGVAGLTQTSRLSSADPNAAIGIELAARAGFDPRAAVTLWQKMGAVGGSRQPQFLSTHPSPETRQSALQALVPRMMPLYEAARGG